MAINVSGEQSVKQVVRSNITGGANVWWSNPVYGTAAIAVDATLSGTNLFRFVPSGGVYVISGINGTTTVTGTASSTTTVAYVLSGLANAAAAGVFLYSPNKSTDLITGAVTEIFVSTASGTAPILTNVSGAVVTQVTGALANVQAAYPNFYGSPYSAPTWVDDATVHNNRFTFSGTGVAPVNVVEQTQVRQIQTNFQRTEVYGGYYIAYSGNLTQSGQKNTKNQQC